jgi:cohesin loading factor subunit SCC2
MKFALLTSRLAGGSSIHLMSALLLQLLHASGHGVIARVRKLRARALDAEVMEAGAEKPDVAQEVCSAGLDSH